MYRPISRMGNCLDKNESGKQLKGMHFTVVAAHFTVIPELSAPGPHQSIMNNITITHDGEAVEKKKESVR